MKRLTFEGNFCDIAMCRENPCPYNGSCSQKETWERLKYFEDLEEQGRLVEVVRCKDCKHFRRNLENDTYCNCVGGLTDPEENDFCTYAEQAFCGADMRPEGGAEG